MARRTTPPGSAPATLTAGALPQAMMEQVAGAAVSGNFPAAVAGSAAVYRNRNRPAPENDRHLIAQAWQVEAYRHINICGEARYAATLFANIAGRAEIGVSEPQTLRGKAMWVESGPEVDAFADLCPTVRERTKLVRDYMLHRVVAGECYLISRKRVETDPGWIAPPTETPEGEEFKGTWDEFTASYGEMVDLFDPDMEEWVESEANPNTPIWEIVAVTELRRMGDVWQVRHDNANWLDLAKDDPIIRIWNPDPENRREAWSPFRSLLPTLVEIEWLTKHIFTQVRSRLVSAGIWFVPNNINYPPPPVEAVRGGAEAMKGMNDAELFMLSLAASGMSLLDGDDVAFPTVVLTDPAALANVDQSKLIKFWSEIDDKAMTLRSSNVRRFALGMDLPPEQILGASGLAVDGSGGSAGSVNHWGVWANEEQTISAHIEPALDDLVAVLTSGFLRLAVEGTTKVIGYRTDSLRLRQDRSKEAMELNARGLLSGEVTLRENGFDPSTDMMKDEEFKKWVLMKMLGGSPTPEQVAEAVRLLTDYLMPAETGQQGVTDGRPGRHLPGNTDDIEVHGPPTEQHDHSPAPFSAFSAACEVLVLRALEKNGNRILNEGKRGRDRDRTTPPVLAHLTASLARTVSATEFNFDLLPLVLPGLTAAQMKGVTANLGQFCADLTNKGEPYSREALVEMIGAN